jgi:ribosome modulation factor
MDIAEDPTALLDDDPALYEALMAGYDARHRGREYDANPYDRRTQPRRHRLWLVGYRAGRRDEIRHRLHRRVAEGGIYGIEVRAPTEEYVCTPCRREDEVVYSIDEALRAPPIPHEHCENGQCRCTYVPITDRHHPDL